MRTMMSSFVRMKMKLLGKSRLKKYAVLALLLWLVLVAICSTWNIGFAISCYPWEKFAALENRHELYEAWLDTLRAANGENSRAHRIENASTRLATYNDSLALYFKKFNIEFLLNKPNLCNNTEVGYLLGVLSAPGNFEARRAIRRTWGSAVNVHFIQLVFLIGSSYNLTLNAKIQEEDVKYRDIVQGNFIDSYKNLTMKTVMLLKWTVLHCGRATFVVKVDDDVYLNIVSVLVVTQKHRGHNKAIIGHKVENGSVERTRTHKFYIPRDRYSANVYPPYVGGPAYIMTGDSVLFLYLAAVNDSFFPMEDVYVTGMCSSRAGVDVIDEPLILTHSKRRYNYCTLNSKVIVHQVSPVEMESLWINHLLKNRDCLNLWEWLYHRVFFD